MPVIVGLFAINIRSGLLLYSESLDTFANIRCAVLARL